MAEEMKITPAAVSKAIAELEKSLGTKLLNRTTRTLSVTERGRRYYDESLRILNEIDQLHYYFESNSNSLIGTLKIAAPFVFSQMYLAPIIADFKRIYPQVNIIVHMEDSVTNLVEHGFDLGIRIQRKLKDSSLVAKKFIDYNHHIVVHPEVREKYGDVERPEDFQKYPCMSYSNVNNQWIFYDSNSEKHVFNYEPAIIANNSSFLHELVINKFGACQLPTFIVEESLKSGSLVELLTNYRKVQAAGWLVFPDRKLQRPIVKKFSDFFIDQFK
ncbi:MAG: LysR substrate-binding domain-containing protein [Lentisphaeraceae bacterium]|nr:LysR substrate-binding domain-containing protein [Lentisphaeraceae bacterium]